MTKPIFLIETFTVVHLQHKDLLAQGYHPYHIVSTTRLRVARTTALCYNTIMSNKHSPALAQHLKGEHSQSTTSEYIKEIVYGGTDGIVTTFAVVAGFSGAQTNPDTTLSLSFATVLLFGLANLFADAFSMGLGNILSERSEQSKFLFHKNKEKYAIRTNTLMEREKTIDILTHKGFSREQAETLVSIYETNHEYWTDWMMQHERQMPDPTGSNPLLTGLATFASFILFGSIPLLPYVLLPDGTDAAFGFSIGMTLLALTLLGIVRWRVIGLQAIKTITETILLGGLSASIAFIVGTFF